MTIFSVQDHEYMQRALSLAKLAHYTTSPNPRVGCVLVKDNIVVGEGYHVKAGQGHAEVNALKQAGDLAKGATAYVTLEPCSHYGRTPPCAEGLIKAGIKHLIAAMVDPNPQVSGNGLKMLEAAGITTQYGLLEQEAQSLNVGFIQLMTTKLPYVRCKLASSIDGKTAMASGESKWITGSAARRNVQRLRAQSCAVITGADSVLTDNAKMNVRWSELGELKERYAQDDLRQPIRVIIDSQNRLTPDLALFSIESPVIIFTHSIENSVKWPYFVEHVSVPFSENIATNRLEENDLKSSSKATKKLNLKSILSILGKRGLNDVLIESGAKLTGAFVEQDLVDEFILFQAPKLMGADGKSLLNMNNLQALSEAKKLTYTDVRMVGEDIRITAKIHKN
ncbi:bifunctional diaminohydroxyphosphoribosylaminopyrimidine deaminase/5-amino-6-(5-phosphoribosylamino)uracil reductase RibD [Pseudocolwellia sp. AS88]|uniref:bifunctional diaminohydroxyphosphoribosylaminopyrimidine deaminase/5-amino-6-(5-phosphoribosylamino)uracil reductase RibD n=1 Tax=Pseudocolwellia sp. AS88 TaxID=3063958 RepID=UPI0026F3758A|nr:bifunctional diaminohydroxyphosphoribosylaminopyrimidine deaminase/5-amino-6-(5-phosphoribosylamino)uracil reductase RibD [Pseudocolwellia sp. AS88]MDO7085447.1 bifunctional diaminohydroxyphosphoribosylaminopyrimidine deaminase/5-amino-6-(5-phosphoribosylamino)uracil reductase RibD [Pseudocolwellia sp. AS88]